MQMAWVLVMYSATASSWGHGLRGFAGVLMIKIRDDDPHPTQGHLIGDVHEFVVEKLPSSRPTASVVGFNFRVLLRRSSVTVTVIRGAVTYKRSKAILPRCKCFADSWSGAGWDAKSCGPLNT
jgi:hypothetical protein